MDFFRGLLRWWSPDSVPSGHRDNVTFSIRPTGVAPGRPTLVQLLERSVRTYDNCLHGSFLTQIIFLSSFSGVRWAQQVKPRLPGPNSQKMIVVIMSSTIRHARAQTPSATTVWSSGTSFRSFPVLLSASSLADHLFKAKPGDWLPTIFCTGLKHWLPIACDLY